MTNNEKEVKEKKSIFERIFLAVLGISGGFAWIVMGTFILPKVSEQMVSLGRNSIGIYILEMGFSLGIAGGAIVLAILGLKLQEIINLK